MAALSATEAADVLRSVAGYEESLTERTAGMTNMVWGMASALIFLTYGTAADLVIGAGQSWLMLLLWIPGVALGMVFTSLLWRSHAVSLNAKPSAKEGWNQFGLNMGLFVAIAAALWTLFRFTDWNWNTSIIMVLANGLFALAVSRMEAKQSLNCSRHTMVAGFFMVCAGILLGLPGLGDGASALAGAATTATGWTASGLWTYSRS